MLEAAEAHVCIRLARDADAIVSLYAGLREVVDESCHGLLLGVAVVVGQVEHGAMGIAVPGFTLRGEDEGAVDYHHALTHIDIGIF